MDIRQWLLKYINRSYPKAGIPRLSPFIRYFQLVLCKRPNNELIKRIDLIKEPGQLERHNSKATNHSRLLGYKAKSADRLRPYDSLCV